MKTVVVGLSVVVDSSVAAHLLKEQGFYLQHRETNPFA